VGTSIAAPHPRSPEQFVIGVAAVNEAGFYLERANSFARLLALMASGRNAENR